MTCDKILIYIFEYLVFSIVNNPIFFQFKKQNFQTRNFSISLRNYLEYFFITINIEIIVLKNV